MDGGGAAAVSAPEALVDDTRLVERGLHVEDGLLRRLQHCVEPAQNRHRQDHVAVLAADVEVPKNIVSDAPGEVGDPAQLTVFHPCPPLEVLFAGVDSSAPASIH